MKKQKNTIQKTSKILWIRGIVFLQFFSILFANNLIFDDNLFTGTLSWTQNSYSTVHFNQEGNDFSAIIFWDTGFVLGSPETVSLSGTNKICHQQVKGTYYNPSRGTKLRPLDTTSLNDLKNIDSSYDTLSLTGGLFYDCDGEDKYQIFGQLTHQRNSWNYQLIAGVEFSGNSYTGIYANNLKLLTPHGLIATGEIFDNYGGVAELQGSWNLDFQSPHIELITPNDNINFTNDTISLSRSGSDNFAISGYRYQVAKDTNFSNIISQWTINDTWTTLINLLDWNYYWKTSAEDFTNHITTSSPWEFSINASPYIQIPLTENSGDIQDAFLFKGYQTWTNALSTVTSDTLVGYTGIDLNISGQICPQVPLIIQSSWTRNGNILETEIDNCIVLQTINDSNYSWVFDTPRFTGVNTAFWIINQETTTVAKIGPEQTLNIKTTTWTITTSILRIPTPNILLQEQKLVFIVHLPHKHEHTNELLPLQVSMENLMRFLKLITLLILV